MYGSGAATGMDRIITKAVPLQIPKALQQGRTACTAAVAGAAMRSFAGRRAAAALTRATAAAAWASASLLPSKQWKSILLSKARFAFQSFLPHSFLGKPGKNNTAYASRNFF